MEEQQKEKKNRKDHWLHERVVVKVMTKRLGDKYHKKKGVIRVRLLVQQMCRLFVYTYSIIDSSAATCTCSDDLSRLHVHVGCCSW